MPIFKIQHVTRYEYDRPVKESVNEVKIFPFQCREQEVLQHDLFITTYPFVQLFTDYWGNKTGQFNLLTLHRELVVDCKMIVRTLPSPPDETQRRGGFDALIPSIGGDLQVAEFALAEKISSHDAVENIITEIVSPDKSVADVVQACSDYVYNNFKYVKGITNIETTVDEILAHRSGVCQDFAHLMLQVLRTLKIPSRYVSGYICPNKNGMRGEGATHAWVEAWLPGYGWAGIDPTNNVWVTDKHIKLAVGRDFNDCSPVKGAFKGQAKQKLSVFVSVGYEDGLCLKK